MFDKVISALIESNQVSRFFDIREEWLVDKEISKYNFIREYIIEYDGLPSFDVINDKFKVSYPVPHGRLPYEIKQLKERHIYLTISDEFPKIYKNLKDQPQETLHKMRQLLAEFDNTEKSKDQFYNTKARERFTDYRRRVGTGGVIHLDSGIKAFNESFYGYYPSDLITVAGRAGLGKTFLCCTAVLELEKTLTDTHGPILLSSNEISHEEIKDRLDCLRFKLPYTNFLKGKLNRRDERRYREGLEQLEENGTKIIILDNVYRLDELRQKIILYKPCMVFVDGSYMLEPEMEEDWKKIVYITRNLKRMAKDYGVPHFNTTQLKRGSGTKKKSSSFDVQDDFSWSSSYTQDSDIALAAYQTPNMQYYHQIGLQFAKGRRVEPGTQIIWNRNLNDCTYDFTLELPDNSNSINEEEDEPVKF